MKNGAQVSKAETVKIVGRRRLEQPLSPAACHRRAMRLIRAAERLNPYPKPRGFVFKAASWQAYEKWRRQQKNPRLW
jgi:hypothetical protein